MQVTLSSLIQLNIALKGLIVQIYDNDCISVQTLEMSLQNSCKIFMYSETAIAECIFSNICIKDDILCLDDEKVV